MSLQKELIVLKNQDKRTPFNQGVPFNFSDSESETTSGQSSWKRNKSQAFPPSMQYGGFFLDEASMLVPADEMMLAMLAYSQAVGLQTTPLQDYLPMLRIIPPWEKGDPSILVTGMLPRPLGKTKAGRNTWQHMCSIDSPESKDALLVVRATKRTKCTPEEHMILSHALKHEKAQACTSKPTPFMI